MVNTILGDIDGKREQLARQGYVIVRSVVPAGMLERFRREAEVLVQRERARDPSWETMAQPRASMTADADEQTIETIEFLLHDNTYGFSARLLGCPKEQVALKIALVLCNPEMTPDQPPRPGQTWGTDPRNWHRDVRPDRDGPLLAHLDDVEANGPGYVQWNVALYEDHVLYVVPGSHRRLNSQIERSHLASEPGRLTPLPQSRRVELGPGDGVVYNNHSLHWGSKYTPSEKRRTLHFGYRSFGRIYPSQRECHLPAGFWETFDEGTPQRRVTDHWLSLNLAEFATIEDMFRGVIAGDSDRFRRGVALLHPAQTGRLACLILLTKVAVALQQTRGQTGSEGAHSKDSTVHHWKIRELAAKFTQDELERLREHFAPVDEALKTGAASHVTGFLGPSTEYEFEKVPAGLTAEELCAAIVAGDCSSLIHE